MITKNIQNQTISERITIARENLGLSKSAISKQMNLSRGMCAQWESGISNPSTAHLIKLAEVLKVSFNWLATGVEEKTLINDINKNINENTTMLKITQLLNKTNAKQKQYLCDLLADIVK